MYKKVLVPLDGSDLAECTLSHLKSLFKDGSVGEVTLLNIVTIDIPWGELESGHFNFNALRKQVFTSSKKYLAKSGIPTEFTGDKGKNRVRGGQQACRYDHGLCPEKRHGTDYHGNPWLYRVEEADAGERGIRCPESVPCTSAFNQTGGLPDIGNGQGQAIADPS